MEIKQEMRKLTIELELQKVEDSCLDCDIYEICERQNGIPCTNENNMAYKIIKIR